MRVVLNFVANCVICEIVIPAKAGISCGKHGTSLGEIPAFAGVTVIRD